MPSNSYINKIERAINQVERAEVLLRQLPLKIYKDKRDTINELTDELNKLARKIQRELAEPEETSGTGSGIG